MIIWKSKSIPDTRTENWIISKAHRNKLEIYWFGIRFTHQYLSKDNNQWRDIFDHWALSITRYWNIGYEHLYYDGPHHIFSLGFLHLYQGNKWDCSKCMKMA